MPAFLKSRTFWGALIVAVARVVGAAPAERTQAAVEGVGVVLTAVGVRGALPGASSPDAGK